MKDFTKEKYKLIMSDFDGTLLKSDRTIDEETLTAIRDFTDRGGIFAISSGRAMNTILPIAKKLGLKGLLSCFNGSVIVDVGSSEILLEKRFSFVDGLNICSTLESLSDYVQAYEVGEVYANTRDKRLEYYEKVCGIKAIVPDIPMSRYLEENRISAVKFLTICEADKRDELIRKLQGLLGDKCFITSGGQYLVEICVKGYTKGTALGFIADYYGIKRENAIAVGDSLNDLEMLKAAGLGIAVKNAEPALKKETFVYGFTNDENAVGRIIKEYGI